MIVDHVNTILMAQSSAHMYMIGRITFPLFCYALAVALYRAGPEKAASYAFRRYGPRLFAIGVLTEPIARWARGGDIFNVLFTLSFGAVLAGFAAKLKDWQVAIVWTLALLGTAFPATVEFSLPGIALPSAILLAMQGRAIAWPFLVALLYVINLDGYATGREMVIGPPAEFAFATLVLFFFVAAVPYGILTLAERMKQSGRFLPKYFLHVFYPAHLALLGAVHHFWMSPAP
jgi:hypothetical protein